MKEVMLVFKPGGRVAIFAEGPRGVGTEKFTEDLAKALGKVEERHKGVHGHHHHDRWQDTLKDHQNEGGGHSH
jgi:hypothetical protein